MQFKRVLASFLSAAMLCSAMPAALPALAADGESLADQIAAAADDATIQLDGNYTEAVTIPKDKSITLDLNGHTLTSETSYVIQNNGELTIIDSAGGGRIERTASGNTTGVINEATGVLTVEGGTIDVTTTPSGEAVGIDNKGRIAEISGGDIIAQTPGSTYSFGIRNQGNAVIDLISGGYLYGGITAFNANGNNAMAIHNMENSTIQSITGGIFVGEVRTGGGGYGIRNRGTVASITGGAFWGNTPDNAVKLEKGSFNYGIDYLLSTEQDSVRTVMHKSNHYVALRNEDEDPIAVYILDANGNIVDSYGHVAESYEIYQDGETVTIDEEDIAGYTGNTTLTVHTTDEPVWYFLGSSVTYGSNNNGNSFADYLEDGYDVTVVKKAVSGTTLVDQASNSYVSRMRNQISENARVDQLIVQLSTNDASQNKTLGALSDSFASEDMDTSTIIGAIEYIIAYAKETWGCDVIFWTNPYYSNDSYRTMYNALFEVQKKWDIGILDYFIEGWPASGSMSDSIHPNEQGYRNMTPTAWEYLSNFNAETAVDPQWKADYEKYNTLADADAGRLVYIDFEDGTAGDAEDRITPIVGSSVTLNAEGANGGKGASIANTNSRNSMILWKQDEYDPFLYADKGSTISMWINADSMGNDSVLFSSGLWGYRFNLVRSGNDLLVSARSYDDNTSEFRVTGFADLIGKGWAHIAVTCAADGTYTVYFNGKAAGSQHLTYTPYDISRDGAVTPKRNTSDEGNQYYAYYSIGGATYWGDRNNMEGEIDEFAIYNRALTAAEVARLADPDIAVDQDKVDNAIALIDKLAAYTDTFDADRAAAEAAYNELNEVEKAAVTNVQLLEDADITKYNGQLEANGGRYVEINFEDGTAGDIEDRMEPIVGKQVSIVDGGKYGQKSAAFTNTKSTDSVIRWKQDEYDPLLYSTDGATISMWVNLEDIQDGAVMFNYGFWGYRFILQAAGTNNQLRIGARNYDSTTSEFSVDGLGNLVGSGWALITVTCDEDKVYSVYFNGELAGQQQLQFSIYDIAAEGAVTSKRNTTDESNQYYGYYSIGGASYWAGNANMVGEVDDLIIFNRPLTAGEVVDLYEGREPEIPEPPVPLTPAEEIDQLIDAIGTVDYSVACGERIDAARAAYDAADADVQAEVTGLADLEKAEADYAALFANIRKVNNALEVTSISGPGDGNERFDKMFDGNMATKFGNSNHTTPIIFAVDEPVTAVYYSFTTGTDSAQYTGRNPKNWTLFGSNNYSSARPDAATWEVIDAVTDNNDLPDANCVEVRFAADTPKEYQYYKLEIANHPGVWIQLTEINLYVEGDVADYTAVDEAIASIPEDLSVYTDETVGTLNAAVEAVVRDLPASQQDVVDDYAEAIEDAIAKLAYKPADYTAVDAAMAKAEALDESLYANFSAVTEAVNAVEEGKNITEQETVDGYAAAIEAALDALVLRGDMDRGGTVDIQDVMAACRVLARSNAGDAATDDELLTGDLDGNGAIDIQDIMEICRILARQAMAQ